jgi:hypothetical protein
MCFDFLNKTMRAMPLRIKYDAIMSFHLQYLRNLSVLNKRINGGGLIIVWYLTKNVDFLLNLADNILRSVLLSSNGSETH